MGERPHALGLAGGDDLGHRRGGWAGGVERHQRLPRGAVAHQLDGEEAAQSADLADARVALGHRLELWADDLLTQAGSGPRDVVVGKDRERLHRDGARERVSGVGEAARVGTLGERRRDAVRDDDAAERHVAGVHALGEGDEVRGHAPVVDGEPLADAAEADHDLVGDHEDPVLVAELAHAGQVAVRRDQHAVGPHHRLEHDGGDGGRALHLHDGAQVVERPLGLLGVGRRVERGAVGVRAEEVDDPVGAHLAVPAARLAGHGDRGAGGAVVAAVGGEHLVAAGVVARHAHGVLVRLGAAAREEHLVEVARGALGDQAGRLGADVVGERRCHRAELLGLTHDGVDQPRVLVAQVQVHQLRREVQVVVALVVPERGARPACDGHRRDEPLGGPRVEHVGTVGGRGLGVGRKDGGVGRGHGVLLFGRGRLRR